MAVTIREVMDSGGGTYGKSPDNLVRYQVWGTTDSAEAALLVDGYAPAEYNGLLRQSYSMRAGESAEIWYADVQYGPWSPGRVAEDVEWQWEVSGSTFHITNALEHRETYDSSGATSADHYKGAINVTDNDGDPDVEGVDIITPRMSWSENHWCWYAFFNPAYATFLYKAVGTVNEYAWRSVFEAGEVLLEGVTARPEGRNRVQVGFKFSASPNQANIVVGDITVVNKFGQDYAWVEYYKTDVSNKTVKRPKFVHVERVYNSTNFNLFGLSTDMPWT